MTFLHPVRPMLGVFVKSPDPDDARIAGAAGFDFAVVDLEHSMLDLGDATALIGVLADNGVHPIVRLPTSDAATTVKVLEAGAVGIQLSSTVNISQVQDVCLASLYPPDGLRGVSFAHRMARWGLEEPGGYLETAAPGIVVVQIETATTEDPLDELFAAGADLVFIGVEDLRVSCRAAGIDPDKRFDEIVDAATQAGVPWGCPAGPDSVAALTTRGGRFFTLGADRAIYSNALAARVTSARSSRIPQ